MQAAPLMKSRPAAAGAVRPAGTLPDGVTLSLFQKVLLTTDGSVTELLALYAGQPIRARKIEQSLSFGQPPAELGGRTLTRLLRRKIMLVDATRNYVYAESTFIFERFSRTIQTQLLETETPIGLLWRQEKVEMYREIIDTRIEQCSATCAHFGVAADSRLVSRTYLLHQQARPLGMITEKFPLHSFTS